MRPGSICRVVRSCVLKCGTEVEVGHVLPTGHVLVLVGTREAHVVPWWVLQHIN